MFLFFFCFFSNLSFCVARAMNSFSLLLFVTLGVSLCVARVQPPVSISLTTKWRTTSLSCEALFVFFVFLFFFSLLFHFFSFFSFSHSPPITLLPTENSSQQKPPKNIGLLLNHSSTLHKVAIMIISQKKQLLKF